MLSYKVPHQLIQAPNPVFNAELRRVRRLRSADSLTRYSRMVMLVPFLALIAWWLLSVLSFAQAPGFGKFAVYNNYMHITDILAFAIFLATLVTMLAVDFYAAAVTVNSIGREMVAGQLDLLRLTAVSPKDYIGAKHATAQIRAWRVLALEVAARMLGVVLLIASVTFDYSSCCYFYVRYVKVSPLVDDFISSMHAHPYRTIASTVVIGIVVAFYIAEPLWRMRVVTALGLAISSKMHNTTFASLTALAALVVIHLAQGLLFILLLSVHLDYSSSPIPGLVQITLYPILLALFYLALHIAALRYARRAAFRPT